jgi:hypothetical protein
LLRCADHLEAIDNWRSGRPLSEQLELNHPRIVFERWQRTLAKDKDIPKPSVNQEPKKLSGFTDAEWTDALRTDLGFERFLRVMPDEWRAQMQLRAANQIIGREKRLHPNKRLKNLTLRIVHSSDSGTPKNVIRSPEHSMRSPP